MKSEKPKEEAAVTDEEIIAEKMAAGLTREQAVEVLARQKEADAGEAKKK